MQVEPEVALLADIQYSAEDEHGQKQVVGLTPRKIAAFNDCSMRKLDGSTKLSEKKNWGKGSKVGFWVFRGWITRNFEIGG